MSAATANATIDHSTLARAWAPQLVNLEENFGARHLKNVTEAARRAIPLLETVESVPFVCRYRTDVIHPLTTRQVHGLHSLLETHASLKSLRTKLLEVLVDNSVKHKVMTSTSKSELEDWYAPFKPPSKGSILERIQRDHPKLVELVGETWNGESSSPQIVKRLSKLGPRESLIHLLGSKVAADPKLASIVQQELEKHCRVQTSIAKDPEAARRYGNYSDFRGHLMRLKDHQVLAIRRGTQQKHIKLGYDIDGSKMEGTLRYHVRSHEHIPAYLRKNGSLLKEVVHDAWSRLLRRRGTSRLWGDKCKNAQERACVVFQTNLQRALLAPPLTPQTPLLALDPGYQAGIKCAVLDSSGTVLRLDAVKFLGKQQETAVEKLTELLLATQATTSARILVALGNGHGSQECRMLIDKASKHAEIPIDIHLVSEAGASVWSVSEAAKQEFPDLPPSAIAAISIGRRLQNPLHELVKVPPRSLGLGMYQHDLSEKELEQKLNLTSVDAVAAVGVDTNSCSLEILQTVPGLSKLALKIVKSRPLAKRADLLKVAGLGPKTFENCAAFCRVVGKEPLDATMVHPESYPLAKWLLGKLSLNLDNPPASIPPKSEWGRTWEREVEEGATKFDISSSRVRSVLYDLLNSISQVDPRLEGIQESDDNCVGSIDGCSLLPPEYNDTSKLASATPLRGIIGTIRNIADFGAFVDFGGPGDGLLHMSKLGPLRLENLLIGQEIGVDILSVKDSKVSLGVHGIKEQQPSQEPRRKRRKLT